MKQTFSILIALLLTAPQLWAFDENDIPPPPMPEYMKASGYKSAQSDLDNDQAETFNNEPIEDIKNEFLQAAQEEDASAEELTNEESNTMTADHSVDDSTPMVEEDPVKKEDLQQVNAMEVAEPEFKQAEIVDPNIEQSKDEYLQVNAEEEPVPENIEEDEVPLDQLASVEENLEQSEQESELNMASQDRKIANHSSFKAGMYKFKKECIMHSEASSMSSNEGVIRPGRKLWIDAHSPKWHKAYKKSGTVYISADCLQK